MARELSEAKRLASEVSWGNLWKSITELPMKHEGKPAIIYKSGE